MKYIYGKPIETYKKFSVRLGEEFYDDEGYAFCNEDSIVMDENNELLAIILKNKIKDDKLFDEIYAEYGKYTKIKLDNRGAIAGKIDINKVRKRGVVKLCKPIGQGFRAQYYKSNGEICKRAISNAVASNQFGYTNSMHLHGYKYYKTNVKKNRKEDFIRKARICRHTRTMKGKGDVIFPLIKKLEDIYEEYLPNVFKKQKELAQTISSWIMNDGVFSTVSIQNNFQTMCHIDNQNYSKGYNVLVIDERHGKRKYGFNLLFPRYKLSVNLVKGDVVIFQSAEYHCNTKFEGIRDDYERISYVFYLKQKLLDTLDIRNATIVDIDKVTSKITSGNPVATLTKINEVNPKEIDIANVCKKVIYRGGGDKDLKNCNNYYFSKSLVTDFEKEKLFELPKKSQIIIDCPFDFDKKDIKRIVYRGYKINFINKELQKQYYLVNNKISHYCLHYD